MKIKYVNIYKIFIYIIVILNLGFSNLVVESTKECTLLSVLFTFLCFLIFLSDNNKPHGSGITLEIVLIICLFILNFLRYICNPLPDLKIVSVFVNYCGMIFPLLAFPMYRIISVDSKSFFAFLRWSGLCALATRTIIWTCYNFLHFNIGPGFINGRENFTREILGLNLVRISGTFLDSFLLIDVLIYLFLKNESSVFKIPRIIELCFLYFYIVFISQSRWQLIITLLITVIFMFYSAFKSKNKYLCFILLLMGLGIGIYVLRNSILNFISSFDPNNYQSSLSVSTVLRQRSTEFFSGLWQEGNRFLGFGFMADAVTDGLNVHYLSDFGIQINLYQFGYLGFVILIVPLLNGLFYFINLIRKNLLSKERLIDEYFVGLFLFLTLSTQNMYLFNLALEVPIYLALNMVIKSKNE